MTLPIEVLSNEQILEMEYSDINGGNFNGDQFEVLCSMALSVSTLTRERDEALNKLAGYEGTMHHSECGCPEMEKKLAVAQLQLYGLREVLKNIDEVDKTPEYDYHGKDALNRKGEKAGVGSRWLTPREIAKNNLTEMPLFSTGSDILKALKAAKSLLEIGKCDLSNPKYDGYFETLKQALTTLQGVV